MSSAGTTTRSSRARTLDAQPSPRPPRRLRPAGDVLAGLWAAVELAMFPLVVLVVVIGAILVAEPPTTGDGWSRTADVAATVWVAAHGVPVSVGGVAFTLVPLGVTVLALFVAAVLGRRVLRPGALPFAVAVLAYAGLVTLATLVFASDVGAATIVLAPLGGVAVAAVGLGIGVVTRPSDARWADRADVVRDAVVDRFPWLSAPVLDGLRRGVVAGLAAVLLLIAASGVLLIVWALSGRSTVTDVLRALDPSAASGVLLGIAQLAVLPNLMAWALAWIVGPGFGIGEGSLYAPGGHVEGALPLLPVVGVLPGAGWANGFAQLSFLLVVAVGVVIGLLAWRAHALAGGTTWSGLATSVVATAVVAGLLIAGLEAVASGAIGPGVMRDVGAQAWKVGGLAALEIGIGVLVATGWKLLDVPGRLRRSSGR